MRKTLKNSLQPDPNQPHHKTVRCNDGRAIYYNWGYVVRLVNEFIEGRYEGLIKLNVIEDLKLGVIMFLKYIPFFIVCVIVVIAATSVNATFGGIIYLFALFVIPILIVNFFKKQTIQSLFEFNILKNVTGNLGDYVVAILKQWALSMSF